MEGVGLHVRTVIFWLNSISLYTSGIVSKKLEYRISLTKTIVSFNTLIAASDKKKIETKY
jgi:hypothetical protein